MIKPFSLSILFLVLCFQSKLFAVPAFEAQTSLEYLPHSQVQYLILCEWPSKDMNYEVNIPAFSTEGLELVRQGEGVNIFYRDQEQWTQKTYRYTFRILEKKARIEAFSLSYRSAPEQAFQMIHIEGRDLHKPVSRPAVLFFAGGVIVAGFIAALFFYIRTRRLAEQARPVPPTLEMRLIEKIGAEIQDKAPKEQIDQASKCLSEYLILKYGINNSELTDYNRIQSYFELKEDQVSLKKIYELMNHAKYANSDVTPEFANEITQEIIAFIHGKQAVGHPSS